FTTGCHARHPTEPRPARCFVPTWALPYALTYCAPVAQLAEATDSKPVQCEFESHRGHFSARCGLVKLQPAAGFLHFHDHLPGIAAREELKETLRHGLDAVTGRDVIPNLSAGNQRRHPLPELPCHVEVLSQHKAAQGEALADRQRKDSRRGRRLRVVVLGNRTTHRNTAEGIHATDGCLQVIAADVIEVDVNPLGRGLTQLPDQVTLAVVDGRVEAQLLEPGNLLLAAC